MKDFKICQSGKTLTNQIALLQKIIEIDSGCGTVGRAVASNSKSSWFESSQRQTFI